MQKSPARNSVLAVLASVPWCCVLPAALLWLSLAGATAVSLGLSKFTWILLPLSASLLGRAFWLVYIKHQGAYWTRYLFWASALVVVILWAPRLL